MKVRISGSNNGKGSEIKTLFTQRGANPQRGFVRVNGKTITGQRSVIWPDLFYPSGINREAAR